MSFDEGSQKITIETFIAAPLVRHRQSACQLDLIQNIGTFVGVGDVDDFKRVANLRNFKICSK